MSNEPTASEPDRTQPPHPEPTAISPPQLPEAPQPAYAYYIDPDTGYLLPYAINAWNERRLHAATIIVQVVRFLKSIAWLIVIVVIVRLSGRGGSDHIEVIATLLGAFSIVGAVFKYLSFRYSISDGALRVRRGIINRKDTVIPIERIQNINLRQDLIHRLLGVADVHVETASGGGDSEAELSVVSLAEAESLRTALSQRTQYVDSHVAQASPSGELDYRSYLRDSVPEGELVYRARLRDLILAGATTNRLGTLIGGAFGLLITAQVFLGQEFRIERILREQAQRFSMPAWTTIGLAIVGLFLLGWLTSIVMSVVSRYGFQLVRVRGQLERSFGLLTRHKSIFPVQRVQMLTIKSPLFQRWVGLCHISAETAGSFRDAQGQGGDQQGTSELCPILHTHRADEMCRQALPTFSYDAMQWQRVSPLARRRSFVRTFIPWTIVVAAGGIWWDSRAWFAIAAVLIFAIVRAVLYYRAIGYAVQDGHLVARRGILTRLIRVVPFVKVQASFVTQSPLQLRLGLGTLKVLTAGAGFGATASIPDLPLETAVALQEQLHPADKPVPEPPAEPAIEPMAEPAVTIVTERSEF